METTSSQEKTPGVKQLNTFKEFRGKIETGELTWKDAIRKAKEENDIKVDYSYSPEETWTGVNIPLNLERLYALKLIENNKYEEAREVISLMYKSYGIGSENEIDLLVGLVNFHQDLSDNYVTELQNAKNEMLRQSLTVITIVSGISGLIILGAEKTSSSHNIIPILIIALVILLALLSTFPSKKLRFSRRKKAIF